MSQRTELSSGQITNTDKLTIELIEPPKTATDHRNHLARQTIDMPTGPV